MLLAVRLECIGGLISLKDMFLRYRIYVRRNVNFKHGTFKAVVHYELCCEVGFDFINPTFEITVRVAGGTDRSCELCGKGPENVRAREL